MVSHVDLFPQGFCNVITKIKINCNETWPKKILLDTEQDQKYLNTAFKETLEELYASSGTLNEKQAIMIYEDLDRLSGNLRSKNLKGIIECIKTIESKVFLHSPEPREQKRPPKTKDSNDALSPHRSISKTTPADDSLLQKIQELVNNSIKELTAVQKLLSESSKTDAQTRELLKQLASSLKLDI